MVLIDNINCQNWLSEALDDIVGIRAEAIKGERMNKYKSALEYAKIVDDDEGICDVEGCPEWVAAAGGMWIETGYWALCNKHADDFRKSKPQPKMKQGAIDREASRGDDGCLPIIGERVGRKYNKEALRN